MSVSTRLRSLRVESGISQGSIAKLIGKSQAWLSYVESGDTVPDSAEIRAIIKAIKTAAEVRQRRFNQLLTQGIDAGVCA